MARLLSPGIETREFDNTNVVPGAASSIGAYVGPFNWGPALTPVNISNTTELVQIFGKPSGNANDKSFLIAESFLRLSNFLRVVRVTSANTFNAQLAEDEYASPVSIPNKDIWDAAENGFGGIAYARYQGALGNSIAIYIGNQFSSVGSGEEAVRFNNLTSGDINNGEISILIVDQLGWITGNPNQILERWENLSLVPTALNEDGSNNFYLNVINERSQFIYIEDLEALNIVINDDGEYSFDDSFEHDTGLLYGEFSLGSDAANELTAGDVISGIELFSDRETIDISSIFTHELGIDYEDSAIYDFVLSLVENRKDCVGSVSAPSQIGLLPTNAAKKNAVLEYFEGKAHSTYIFASSSPVYVYNRYTDKFQWIPSSGIIAGLFARTDLIADPWFSPAGYNRGQLVGVAKLGYNPSEADRDDLYVKGINPLVSFPGQGPILYGDKTFVVRESAFSRINVRRLFIILRKSISEAAKFQLFELNDEFTRAMFRNMVEPFLREIKGRRGITDFAVICDTTNNTDQVIADQQFVAGILVKPARSINFMRLDMTAVRGTVEFNEVVVRN